MFQNISQNFLCLLNLFSFTVWKLLAKKFSTCSISVWWWKLEIESSRGLASFSIECFLGELIASQLSLWNSFGLHFGSLASLCSSFSFFDSLYLFQEAEMQVAALPQGVLSIKVTLFMLHSLVLQCEMLFYCSSQRRIACFTKGFVFFFHIKIVRKFEGENTKEN